MNFKSLNGLRAIATLGIFVHHHWALLWIAESKDIYKDVYSKYIYEGFIGVTLFFILSGFLMTINYENKFDIINKKDVKLFYKKRILKIYPAHIITFLYSLLLLPICWDALLQIFLIQSYSGKLKYAFSYNGPSWFLSSILFSYLIFPFVMFFLKKRIQSLKAGIIILVSVYILEVFLVITLSSKISAHYWFYVFPPFRFLDFLMGVLIALIFYNNFKLIQINKKILNIAEVALLVILILFMVNSSNIREDYRFNFYYSLPFTVMLFVYLFSGGWISALLSKKVFQYISDLSLYIYLSHGILIGLISGFINKHGLSFLNYFIIIRIVFDFGIVFIVSILFKKIDEYIVSMIKRNFLKNEL